MSSAMNEAPRQTRAGITLLEVLIACGVLVVGLTSVAALMPATGARLAEAALEDRVGVAAGNAYADIINRGLLAADVFTDRSKPAVFGRVLPTAGIPDAVAASTATRIDPTRGFLAEDDVVYEPPTIADTPNNLFLNAGQGAREFKEGICWGALIVPRSVPVAPGSAATLGVAVFKRAGAALALPLSPAGGAYSTPLTDDSVLNNYLKSCSWVLASAGGSARWFRIQSSWKSGGSAFIVFTDPGFAAFAGGSPTVIAFEGLMRVDEYPVVLE